MKRLLALLTLLVGSTLYAAAGVPEYRWLRDVALPEITTTTLVAVPLDSHFFESTREGWPDVRLRNDRNESVGFLIRAAHDTKTRTVREFWTAEQASARVDANAGLQVELVRRDKEPAPTGIRIVTPLRDFEHQVRVESSSDGETWTSAGPASLIFDYSRFVDARNDLVSLDAGAARRFRLTIEDVTAEQESVLKELHRRLRGSDEISRTERTTIARRPFRVDRIEFYRDSERVESSRLKTTDYPATNFTVTQNEKEHQTIVVFDTHREPITEVTVNTTAENVSRETRVEVEVEETNGQKAWKAITHGTVTRLSIGTIERDVRTLTIPETRSIHYRVVNENRDSAPIPITGVELRGPQYQLLFLASPAQKATVEYGSSTAEPGHYDTAALQASLSAGHAPLEATLQSPQENKNAPLNQSQPWAPWNDSRILTGAIVLFTLLLASGLFFAARRIDATPPR